MKTLAALCAVVVTAAAQDAPARFTSSTNQVLVDLAVSSDRQRVPELQRGDFVLLDNGTARAIDGFSHDELPLDIVFVCQLPLRSYAGRTYSIFDHYPEDFDYRLGGIAADTFSGLRPGDRVGIVSYGRDPRVDLRPTGDRKAINAAIKRVADPDHADSNIVMSSEGLAIEYAVRLIADAERDDTGARTGRRRLIVLVSNPFGVGTRYADQPVIWRLWDQNIVFSVIDNDPPAASTTTIQRTEAGDSQTLLFQRYSPIHIAQATGGDRIVALDLQHPVNLLTASRQHYTLSFKQPPDATPGETRSIKVDLSGAARRRYPDAVVRAREGYVAR